MLDDAVKKIKDYFKVEFHDYERKGNSILISAGFGIGLALMDEIKSIRYFIDIEEYRNQHIDWESISVILACEKPDRLYLTSYFSTATERIFDPFIKGFFNTEILFYNGQKHSLADLIKR